MAPQGVSVTRSYNNEFAAALRKIHQPTLLIWSKGDKTVPFSYSLTYIEMIQDVDFFEVPPSVGHAVTRKYPEDIAVRMEKFLRKFEKASFNEVD